MYTIPTIQDALDAVEALDTKAAMEAAEAERQLKMRRAEFFGRVITAAQQVMAVDDIDDIPRLEAALAALHGETSSAPTLTVEEENLLGDYRKRFVRLETKDVKNDDGTTTVLSVWRDTRFGAFTAAGRSPKSTAPVAKDDAPTDATPIKGMTKEEATPAAPASTPADMPSKRSRKKSEEAVAESDEDNATHPIWGDEYDDVTPDYFTPSEPIRGIVVKSSDEDEPTPATLKERVRGVGETIKNLREPARKH